MPQRMFNAPYRTFVWLVMAVCGFVYAGQYLHRLVVQHHMCYQHQQLEHFDASEHSHAVSSSDALVSFVSEVADMEEDHAHDACAWGVWVQRRMVCAVRVAQGFGARPPPLVVLANTAVVFSDPHAVPVFETAPKNSPPHFV
jgi:hypothetical protein